MEQGHEGLKRMWRRKYYTFKRFIRNPLGKKLKKLENRYLPSPCSWTMNKMKK
jgi:hypothetical protein